MSTSADEPAGGDHLRLYGSIATVFLVALIIGLFAYSDHQATPEAKDKAAQLEQAFTAAGLTVPADTDMITRTLGSDGGAVCDAAGSSLGKGLLNAQLSNGASFVGQRPILAAREVVLGEALILKVYCPDKLAKYQSYIDDLKLRDTIRS